MVYLGICIWLISAILAYFVEEVAVLCCDRREWDRKNSIVIAIWSLLLGPFALVISLEVLLLAEMAEGMAHKRMLCHRH